MPKRDFSIHGRVHSEDGGILGLTVDASDKALRFHDEMSFAVTAEDGTFRIGFDRPGLDRLFAEEPEIMLTVRDLEGEVVSVIDGGKRCKEGSVYEVDVQVDASVLARHRDLARRIQGSGGILTDGTLPAIAAAWDALSISRGGAAGFQRNAAYCPGPPLMRYPDIVDVAQGVIQGNPEDLLRFADMMGVMRAAAPKDPEAEARFQRVTQLERSGAAGAFFETRLKEMTELRESLGTSGRPVPSEDAALPVILAAAMMGGGDPRAMHANLGVITHNFCELGRLGPVISAAEGFARIGPAGLAGFDRAWTDYMDMWGPDDGPPIPQPGGTPQPGPDPDPWPNPWPPEPDGFPAVPEIEQWICTAEVVQALRLIGYIGGGTYDIQNVTPARACPGDTITISGVGFGLGSGSVRFATDTGSVTVSPTTWSDTEITVEVPENAECGALTLRINVGTAQVCGRFVTIYKHPVGLPFQFEGGRTRVRSMQFQPTSDDCLRPGQSATFQWSVCNATQTDITLRAPDGSVLAQELPTASQGSIVFNVPNVTTRGEITASININGPCGSDSASQTIHVEAPYALSINGMEVSQAIQHYRSTEHLTTQTGPDNSLRLVRNKAALVRVYLRSGGDPSFNGGALDGVTGSLSVERRTNGLWNPIGTLNPINAPVTANESYANHDQERSNLDNTLNFLVPANLMSGLIRFVADVSSPDACGDQSDTEQIQVVVDLSQTLNAAFITVAYNGRNATNTGTLNLAAPGLATCIAETSWAMAAFPISGTPNVRIAGSITSNIPLDDARTNPGGCSPNWGPTLAMIATAIAADTGAGTTQWLYYGLIANGIPVNVPGCAIGVTGGISNQALTYAHEIGHILGLPHAPCGNVGSGNPNYPSYAPYDLPADPPGASPLTTASIGEYGIDMRFAAPQVRGPAGTQDFMSYCGPRWISKYTHQFLVNQPSLSPVTTPVGDAGDVPVDGPGPFPDFGIGVFDIRDRIYLIATIDEEDEITVERVSRLPARDVVSDGARTDLVFELLGEKDEVLSAGAVYSFHREGGCGCGGGCGGGHGGDEPGPQTLAAMIDDVAPGARMRLRRRKEKEDLWNRSRPETEIKVELEGARIEGETLSLSWQSNFEDAETWVRVSLDKGESWRVLSMGLTEAKAELDIAHLPAGPLLVQVMVQDGYGATVSETAEVTFEGAAPQVAILTPSGDLIPRGSDQLLLRGTAFVGEEPAKSETYNWAINGEPVKDRGPEVIVPRPKPGSYEITLTVTSEHGTGRATRKVSVTG